MALINVGILTEGEDGKLGLIPGAEDEAGFRRAVTQRVFIPEDGNNADVWALRTERQPEHHAELALAWLHLQGITSPAGPFAVARGVLQSQFGADRVVLRDTAPFNAFERFARWCGVAAHISEPGGPPRIIPDLTEALRTELDQLLPPVSEAPAREVVDRAANVFPWLPTGTIGQAVAQRMGDTPDSSISNGTVPEGLSLALVQLHHEALIELIPGDDASDRITLAPGGISDSSGQEVVAIARIRRRDDP
jgi:hypothetical protein